jgi:hypothetical protein
MVLVFAAQAAMSEVFRLGSGCAVAARRARRWLFREDRGSLGLAQVRDRRGDTQHRPVTVARILVSVWRLSLRRLLRRNINHFAVLG